MGVVVFLVAGTVFEQIGERRDRRRYPQIGRSVDIGGRTLNIFCSGEGAPAVVFDTFGHSSGYSWNAVQAEAAKFTRACWYDRAGYGWSDPAPMPRTFQMVATDLHQLLHAAGVTPPYVFVAKGDAASHIRVYHGLYPNEVAGVVMVNANDVDENDVEIPESAKGGWAKHFGSFAPRVRGTACTVFPLLAQTGLVRLGSMFQGLRRTDSMNLQSQEQTMLDFLSDNPTAARGSELCAREISMEQVRASGTLGNVPLIVMATVRRISTNDSSETAAAIAWNKNQAERVQPGLVRLSSRGHLILLDEDVNMQMMIGAIREVVAPAAR